jgi:hypothetical protein
MKRGRNSLEWLALSSLLCMLFCHSIVTADKMIDSAFDSSVQASYSVANMENLSYASSVRSTLIGADGSVPGEVHYSFSIKGTNSSAGALGFARSEFLVSSLEGRDTGSNLSSERFWKDVTEVSGTIVNFRKNFDYTSGLRL